MPWKTFEPFEAPSIDRNQRVQYGISQEFVETMLSVNRLNPIFQISAHIYGNLPRINLISRVSDAKPTPTLTTLDDAHACFQGICRPHDDENNGDSVLVYVLRPTITIERSEGMACMARAAVLPQNCVLTVVVRTGKNLVGFKLKGFKNLFTHQLQPTFKMNDQEFLRLVSAIEKICLELGEQLVADDERKQSYRAAAELAANDNVKLSSGFMNSLAA